MKYLLLQRTPFLVQRPHDVPKWMRRRHALEPVEEGDDEDIDIALRNFMEKNSKKAKKI